MLARLPSTETWTAILGVVLGVVVSVKLALLGPPGFILVNASFFWVPQLFILVLLWPFKPRPAVIAGASAVLAIYLWVYDAWIHSINDREGLAWLGYLFSFPGASIGAIGALFLAPRFQHLIYSAVAVSFAAACAVATGIFVNQVIICHTVMYCSWLKPY
jgi:hypothetical protein